MELIRENDIEVRWREYFVQLLNGDEVSEVGVDVLRARIRGDERVVRKVGREETMGALKKMKGGKAAGVNAIVVKMSKNGGIGMIDWLRRIFNLYL